MTNATDTAKPMTQAAMKRLVEDRVTENLRTWLLRAKAYGVIYYNIPNISRSGMSRDIQLARLDVSTDALGNLIPVPFRLYPEIGDRPDTISDVMSWYDIGNAHAARVLDYNWKRNAFVIGGCGMDMVFALINRLARVAEIGGDYANHVKRSELF